MTPDDENKRDEPQDAAAVRCLVCGKPATAEHRPFCSKHCAHVDLQRWFTGRYTIPVVEEDSDPDGDDPEA